MIQTESRNELLVDLKNALEQYDMVLLFLDADKLRLFAGFCGSAIFREIHKKVLVLSAEPFAYDGKNPLLFCEQITVQKAMQLKKLYLTYEFSDRFQIIMENDVFGGLWNLAETGILSSAEVFLALLH